MTFGRKALVIGLALALLGVVSVGAARNAAATQNAPSLGTGNQWTYIRTDVNSGTASSLTLLVKEQTTLTLGGTGYSVWHVKQTTVQPFSGSTLISYDDLWVTVDGLRVAKTVTASVPVLGNTTFTYAPPMPQAVFPLNAGGSWSVPSQATTVNNLVNITVSITTDGIVNDEQSVSVPAGVYTAAVIRSPSSGNPYSLSYYSESAGGFVRIDRYNGQGRLTSVQNLTSTNYSPGLFGIPTVVWILGFGVLVVVVAAAVIMLRRRSRSPYPMPPYRPPYQPPPKPPQQGPPGT